MSRRARPPEQLRGRVFSGVDAVRRGLLTRRQLQSQAFRRLFRNVYADAALELDHGLRCRGARLLMPPQAAFAGQSAAWFHGVRIAGPDEAVHVVVPLAHRFGPVTGLRIRVADLPPHEIQGAPRRTTPGRTAWDLACTGDLVASVAFLDALIGHGWVTVDDITGLLSERPGSHGCRRARRALALTDARSESPQESRLRVRLVLAGIPRPESQYPVRSPAGEFVGRVDLAWPACRVAVEYDGVWHAEVAQFRRDRHRLNRLLGAGWLVLHVTSDRLARDLDGFAEELRAALTRRGGCTS